MHKMRANGSYHDRTTRRMNTFRLAEQLDRLIDLEIVVFKRTCWPTVERGQKVKRPEVTVLTDEIVKLKMKVDNVRQNHVSTLRKKSEAEQ